MTNLLLTSVRSLGETRTAVEAGSDWIDLKDPQNGALGPLDTGSVTEIVAWLRAHYPQTPVSATVGEHLDGRELEHRVTAMREAAVDYVKFGLDARTLPAALRQSIGRAAKLQPRLIAVCFAEHVPNDDVVRTLCRAGCAGIMLDTAAKSKGSLLEVMDVARIRQFVELARAEGKLCGLAGRLRLTDVSRVAGLGADYVGFRSAVCEHGDRREALSGARVVALKRELRTLDDRASVKRAVAL